LAKIRSVKILVKVKSLEVNYNCSEFQESDMETMKSISHIGCDGILLLQMPTEFKDTSVEVLVVVQPLPSEEVKPKYNAWGKLTTKKSIQAAVAKMLQLQKEIALDKNSIRSMIEEGRRF
jgi:hypothetical protein